MNTDVIFFLFDHAMVIGRKGKDHEKIMNTF